MSVVIFRIISELFPMPLNLKRLNTMEGNGKVIMSGYED